MKSRILLTSIACLWVLGIGIDLRVMRAYEVTPGATGKPPTAWPHETSIQRSPEVATLVMLVHPQCACSRASIGELELLRAKARGRVHAYVLFLKPTGFPDSWETTDLWQSAARIPGVTVLRDADGKEARLFQAATSGQTMLYGTTGQLLFSGGITGSRGHLGDNAGYEAILSLLGQTPAEINSTAVYGCPLHNPTPKSSANGSN